MDQSKAIAEKVVGVPVGAELHPTDYAAMLAAVSLTRLDNASFVKLAIHRLNQDVLVRGELRAWIGEGT